MKHPVTIAIVALNTLGFVAQCVAQRCGWPLTMEAAVEVAHPQWWQMLTYMWLHGNPVHLMVNLVVLWPFATVLEERMGPIVFALGYIVCGAFAASMALPRLALGDYVVGASGAVFAAVAMYGVLFFRQHIKWIFLPKPIPVWLFFLLLVGVEVVCSIKGYLNAKIHLAGMVEGISYAIGCVIGQKLYDRKMRKKFGS